MRILRLHSRYMSGAASGENQTTLNEVKILREAGHEVELWTPGPDELTGLSGKLGVGMSAIWSRRAVAKVRDLIGSLRPDVVHCTNLFPMLSPAVLRAIDGPAVVLGLHNYRLMCLPATFLRDGSNCEACLGKIPWRGVVHRCYRGSVSGSSALATSLSLHRVLGTFDRVDLFVAVSDYVRSKHLEVGLDGGKIIVKPHFAWPSVRREGPGEYFLYIGRLSPEKGVATLLQAWSGRKERLLIAGDGPQRSVLEAEAPPGVEFLGTVPYDRVPQLLAGARAVLIPSLWAEPAGRVVFESYAAGVPAVASRSGGLMEYVTEPDAGLLVTPGDVPAWRDAIEEMSHDSRSQSSGQSAWNVWRERYGPEPGLRALERAYEIAVARRRAA